MRTGRRRYRTGGKTCWACGQKKPLSLFPVGPEPKRLLMPHCYGCSPIPVGHDRTTGYRPHPDLFLDSDQPKVSEQAVV